MRVLITTFGVSWSIVPELYGFTNPEDLPLYAGDSAMADSFGKVAAVDEIWLITTEGADGQVRLVRQWAEKWKGRLRVRVWWPQGVSDLRDAHDVRRMSELIFSVVAFASRRAESVVLSLAGGRKTMSVDLQRAGHAFGCAAMLHVVDRMDVEQRNFLREHEKDVEMFQQALPEVLRGKFLPVIVAEAMPRSDAVTSDKDCGQALGVAVRRLPEDGGAVLITSFPLIEAVDRVIRQADHLRANFAIELSQNEHQASFRALYTLPGSVIQRLKDTRLCASANEKERELAWLQRLPKADLHCHLGGVLSLREVIEAASEEACAVEAAERAHEAFARDMRTLRQWVCDENLAAIHQWLGARETGEVDFRVLRKRWQGVREPLGVCGFLLAFADHPDLLDMVVYGDLRNPERFVGVGIDRYERLGDLQGSGLIQSEPVLRGVMRLVARRCREENIRYLELRCSPLNYTRGSISSKDKVLAILADEAERASKDVDIRFLFIASRHGNRQLAAQHVELANRLLEQGGAMQHRFVGFDLAGAERMANPSEFRDMFRPLHKESMHITIHAGEGESVGNIWEAAYELNADRVGHGLTLGEKPRLLERFRDRKIAIEMCPSSNFQIVGFADHMLNRGGKTYPLKDYLDQGLRVTINTDDPGISRTTLGCEYYKAAAMSRGGLSRWDVLQLVRNGFRAAFCSHEVRRRHLLAAEKQVVELVMEKNI